MRRLTAVALLVIGFALPVCAQRGASRSGFSGHSAPAFRGGFSRSVPSRFAASPGFSSRSFGTARGLQRGTAGSSTVRPPYTGSRRDGNRYRPPYRSGVRYGVAGPIYPYSLAYPYGLGYDAMGYDDSGASANAAPAGPDGPYSPNSYDAESAPQELPPYPPPPDQAQPTPAPPSAEAVTLVFKDGRPPEQIHNYILTRNTLYVRDQHPHDIPTDQLDFVATAKVNQAAGVDFQLPSTLQ